MTKPVITESEFLGAVNDHVLMVIADNGGIYRHLRFKAPETGIAHFDLITWPGHLCYTGDMGTFVFQRIADMFNFFRLNKDIELKDEQTLSINPAYWSEKLLAVEKNEGFEEWSEDLFREAIEDALNECGATDTLREAVENDVLSALSYGLDAAMNAASDFSFDGFTFVDFHENNFEAYTYRFLWACYAIQWGIQFYDEAKKEEAAALKEAEGAAIASTENQAQR